MHGRKRFAFVAMPLLGLLAALLLGWSVAAAQAGDPLTLTITAERAECTAGTLNPVSWEIEGGVGPYRLTVDGASVDADAGSATVTCGALPEGATEAPATISTTVTDATGAPATASAAYTIVPPLPAPTGLEAHALRTHMLVRWGDVAVPASAPSATADCPCPLYLLRWRVADTDAWTMRLQPVTRDSRPGDGYELLTDMTEGTTYELTVAALRDAIERETPVALAWSPTVTETTIAPATGVRAVATHDTITVSWDPQPAAEFFSVSVRGSDGSAAKTFTPDGDTPHQVVFRHLPPDTEYTVRVAVDGNPQSPVTEITVSTTAAPAEWTPLPRGPQNLRTAVTHNSVTVDWDAPHAGANDHYHVFLFHTGADREPTAADRREHKALYGTGITEHTFTGLAPATTYRVAVRHSDIVSGRVAVAVTTLARAAPPLRLTLTAGRAECTAGTLNPVAWEIEGGVEPYRLTIDGEPVDADAESATVTCAALPEGATEAAGTITATVTDATGAPATASAAYTIVPPLPAPVATADVDVMRFSVKFAWRALTVPASCDVPTGCFAFRTRLAGDTSWEYSWDEHLNAASDWPPLVYRTVEVAGTTVEAGIASIRDPIEIETPAALDWAATVQATSLTDIGGLLATATHDTVTVRWNRQPSADSWKVYIDGVGLRGGQSKSIRDSRAGWGDPTSATHEVTFTDLPPDTEYEVAVWGRFLLEAPRGHAVQATTTVRTAVAPPDHTPRVRGPQNLRATATHDTITVSWDHPWPETEDDYWLGISSPTASVPIRHINARVFPPASQYTYTDLDPSSTYRIVVMHNDIVREGAAITITTKVAPPAGATGADRETECIEITPGWRICWTPDVTSG